MSSENPEGYLHVAQSSFFHVEKVDISMDPPIPFSGAWALKVPSVLGTQLQLLPPLPVASFTS